MSPNMLIFDVEDIKILVLINFWLIKSKNINCQSIKLKFIT
jgi:hypothetical protein